MALNIDIQTKKRPANGATPEATSSDPDEPVATSAAGEDGSSAARSTRGRRTRGSRGSGSSRASAEAKAEQAAAQAQDDAAGDDTDAEGDKRPRRGRRRPAARTDSKTDAKAETADAKDEPDGDADVKDDDDAPRRTTRRRAPSRAKADAGDGDIAKAVERLVALTEEQGALLEQQMKRIDKQQQLLEQQGRKLDSAASKVDAESRKLDKIARLVEDGASREGGAPRQRVGIFVDVANVELAADRYRDRFDWKKILKMLTRDRDLVRAVAYSPVHEDLNVSIESQRFVEPFLDSEYKVVTKPLKKFQDGTVKANVDIEITLDIMSMLDRLDVVCLVSGDGDFKPLVEVCQSRGVRVEVVGVGPTVARQLKEASDVFIDLHSRMKELRAG